MHKAITPIFSSVIFTGGEIINNTVCDFSVHGEGVKLDNLKKMLIQNNSVSDGTVNPLYGWMGFSVIAVRDSVLRNNTLHNVFPYGFWYAPGINMTPNLTFDETNTHDGRSVLYGEQKSDYIIEDSANLAMIVLLSCHNSSVRNTTVQNSGLGIGIYNGTDTHISGNRLYDINNGIMLVGSNRTDISHNTFQGNWFGIGLGTNSDTDITYNQFSNYTDSGIVLHTGLGTELVNITNNSFTGYYPGKEQAIAIMEASGDSILIANNTIINNTRGMLLESSQYFIIRDNLIQSGGIGFNLVGAKNNTFFSNRILNDDEYSEGLYVISSKNSDGGDVSKDNIFANNYVLSTRPVNVSTISDELPSLNYTWDKNQWGVFVPGTTLVHSDEETYPNVWNLTKTPGSNIVNGLFLGGNYYATPDGTGWSEVHPDRGDGFVTEPYVFNNDNIDYLPLHLPATLTPTPTPTISPSPTPTIIPSPTPSPTLTPTPSPTPGKISANFSASMVLGTPPLEVHFTDTTSGNPESWYWTFGDGNVSHDQNPVHRYTGIGRYTVSLEVSSKLGQSVIRKDSFIVTKADWISGPNGAIWITSNPDGAQVYADGKLLGVTPLEYIGIPAGTCQIRISYDGYQNWTHGVQINQGKLTYVPLVVLNKETISF